MPLYRLDYFADGRTTTAVQGSDIGVLTLAASAGDILTHHMTKAREYAKAAAKTSGCDVQIAGIIKGGQIKPRLIVSPDGTTSKPGSAKDAGGCKAASGQTCFCPVCRAKRRDARRA